MARSLRIEYENALYHVTAHSIDEGVLFRDAADRTAFLNLLARVCEHYEISCLAWCLMTNHYHLVLQTENLTWAARCNTSTATSHKRRNVVTAVVGLSFCGATTRRSSSRKAISCRRSATCC